MNLVQGITKEGVQVNKYAAMYYKTEPFYTNIDDYKHTNNWEILKAVEILCDLGFSVDLIDRGCKNWSPNKEYDLFLGLGVGNSGDQFVKYSKSSRAKKRVLIAQGPQPDTSNRKVLDRYAMFHSRTGVKAPPMRTVDKVCGENFLEIVENTDYILCIGEKGTESYNSFLSYGKPVLEYYPAVTNRVSFNEKWFETRNSNEFLCFAGNGFICKGVDLLVESFLKSPDKKLHICGPRSEPSFFRYYEEKIKNSSNIFFHGFVTPGGKEFNHLASVCSYVIFHSAAEGCCTSVVTAMKAGLVPIVNSWTGILINDKKDGVLMREHTSSEHIINEIQKSLEYASKLSKEGYVAMVENNNIHTQIFGQESYLKSYESCIRKILEI